MASVRQTVAVAVAAVTVWAWAASAGAQGPECGNYIPGMSAIKARRWADAVAQLEKAVQLNPRSVDSKKCEGSVFEPYHPHYYLAKAYLELKDYQRARDYLRQAREFGRRMGYPEREEKELARMEQAIEDGLHPIPGGFDGLLDRAEQNLKSGSCAVSVQAFQDAQSSDKDNYWFKKRGADTRLAVAQQCAESDRLYGQAQGAFDRGQLRSAEELANSAIRAYAQNTRASGLLGTIRDRNKSYDTEKASGSRYLQERNRQDARLAFGRARSANPERFASEKLDEQIAEIDRLDREDAAAAAKDAKERERLGLINAGLQRAQDAYRSGSYDAVAGLLDPVLKEDATNGQALLLKSRARSRILLAEGHALRASGNYAGSEKKYQEALQADRENTDADSALRSSQRFGEQARNLRGLVARKDQAARAVFDELKGLDSARVVREKLDAELAKLPAPPKPAPPPEPTPVTPTEPKPTTPATTTTDPTGGGGTTELSTPAAPGGSASLRNGMVSLFSGKLDDAVRDLESATDNTPKTDRDTLVLAHAYLGVARATLALVARDDTAASRDRRLALESFGRALDLRPDYVLVPRLVSPSIRSLFEEARAK